MCRRECGAWTFTVMAASIKCLRVCGANVLRQPALNWLSQVATVEVTAFLPSCLPEITAVIILVTEDSTLNKTGIYPKQNGSFRRSDAMLLGTVSNDCARFQPGLEGFSSLCENVEDLNLF